MPFSPTLQRELGVATTAVNTVTGYAFIDDWEDTPELRWPLNLAVFDRMDRTDAQCAATMRCILLPALGRVTYGLGTEGVDPRVLQFVQTELGLEERNRGRARRRREGIVFREHARSGIRQKLKNGHGIYEQVYQVGPPSPEQTAAGMPPAVAHLQKLALRPARTIADWKVRPNGSLEAVAQYVPGGAGVGFMTQDLPLERLVLHVNDREGANWRGESIYRASYKHWMIKDSLLRWGAQAVERNGMGFPIVTYDPGQGATRSMALALARSVRAGSMSGAALPPGYTLVLKGVEGQTKDELPLVKYHDQAIGKNALAMVLDLGHDAGARALGQTFMDIWTLAENAIIGDFCEEMTEYVIRDLVALSFGEDEAYPPLEATELTPDQALTATDLAALVKAGVIIPDDELEMEIRRRSNLPLWPGAPVDDLDFTVEDILQVPSPDAPPHVAPSPAVVPVPTAAGLAGRAVDELRARVAVIDRQLEARASGGRPARR